MSTYTYLLAGVADTEHRMLTRTTALHAGVTVRAVSVVVPGVHGATPGGPVVFEAPPLTMEWELLAPTWEELDAEYAALAALLARPNGVEVVRRVTDDAAGDIDTRALARLKAITESRSEAASPLTTVTVVMELLGVFWRGALVTTTPELVTTDVAVDLGALEGSSAPVADAVLRVQGPASEVSVVDVASGTGLSWAGALTAAQYLYLDAASLRAWRAASDSAWSLAEDDVSPGLGYPAPGPLELWPLPADGPPAEWAPRVTVTGAGRGPTSALAVRAAPAYL